MTLTYISLAQIISHDHLYQPKEKKIGTQYFLERHFVTLNKPRFIMEGRKGGTEEERKKEEREVGRKGD